MLSPDSKEATEAHPYPIPQEVRELNDGINDKFWTKRGSQQPVRNQQLYSGEKKLKISLISHSFMTISFIHSFYFIFVLFSEIISTLIYSLLPYIYIYILYSPIQILFSIYTDQ